MQFVYPAFLFGLAALAIPVVIHLFNFRRFKTVYFTNVRFLKQVQEETATKNRLKHLLVLFARLLAIAFLVFAFAQPFIPSPTAEQESVTRAVSIYLDNSFSMESEVDDERLIDVAKRKAEEIVQGYSVDDRFQLITNDLEAKHQRMVSRDEMIQLIAEVQVSPVSRPLQEIVDRQRDVLNRASDKAAHISYLLSDFQKNAGTFENDTTIAYNLIPLTQKAARNVAVDSIWFVSPVQMLNQPVQLCVRLRNFGEADMENVPVTLKLNDQIKAIADLSVPAMGKTTDTLSFSLSEGGWYSGEISLKDYPVTFDDLFFFSFRPVDRISVLSINGQSENTFIRSLFGNDQMFALQNNAASQIAFSELTNYDLIILNELPALSNGLAAALQQQLERGANVLILPSLQMDARSFDVLLQPAQAALYGNVFNRKRLVSDVNTANPVFADVFEKVPRNLAMPYAAQSFELRSNVQTREEALLQFTDRLPMLARYPAYQGYLFLSAVPLNRDITDLPVQAGLFAPLMYKMAVSNTQKLPLYANIGEAGWIDLPGMQLPGDAVIRVKNEQGEFIPEIRRSGNRLAVNLSSYVQTAGMYSLIPDKGVGRGDQLLAMNYNRRESDMQFADAQALSDRYDAANITVIDDPERNLTGMVMQMATGTPLWKFCVIFALVFLAAEILLIRFMP